jgi:hypothetical protein
VAKAEQAKEKKAQAFNNMPVGKVAGLKRKSLSEQDMRTSTMSNGGHSGPGHKRSKTMTPAPNFSASISSRRSLGGSLHKPISSIQPNVSVFAEPSIFGRSTNTNLRQSTTSQKLDTTRTDYFRLKAMGVDPDTPLIPDTKETLALRRKREVEARQASINSASRGYRSASLENSPAASMPPPPVPPPRASTASLKPSQSSAPTPVEDDFLKQIRAAREAMAEETEWMRQQQGVMEKEIEQAEELRRSQGSRDSPLSMNGLARVNGYEYLPADIRPGTSMSRTEQRIRRTGAHGLATKPLRSRSEYVPVAMSKRSAYGYASSSQSTPDRKRSRDDVETQQEAETIRTAIKRPRAGPNNVKKPVKSLPKARRSQNPYQMLQGIEPEDDDSEELSDDKPGYQNGDYVEEEDGVEDEDEDDKIDDMRHDPSCWPGDDEMLGELADDDDEEDLEEEEDEEEEEDGYGSSYLQAGQYAEDYDDAPTPLTNPQISRAASSAPGGSADDAFVIDDSD